MNIAVLITLSRILLLPPALLPVLAGWHNSWLVSAAVVALAGLTDMFDGYLARRTGQVTPLGAGLDLAADKLFVGTMFLLAAWYDLIPWWVPLLIISREIIISYIRLSRSAVNPLVPDIWGKAKTAVSFLAVILLLLQQDVIAGGTLATVASRLPVALLSETTLSAAVALTVVSGINYLGRYARGLRAGNALPVEKEQSVRKSGAGLNIAG